MALVVAIARNGVIGRDNALPWRLPDEMAHFRRVTLGKPVVMGRKTWESLKKPLAGRDNIVVTHRPGYEAAGAIVVHSLEEAWSAARRADEVCVIGGSTLYAETLPIADVIYLTEVDADVEGDTRLPAFDRAEWEETEVARHPADDRHAYPFRILELRRR
ncbi:MAG: dihydrofolate reductase [Usitatibacter sp.]